MRAISMGAVALAMVVVLPGCVSLGGKAPDMLIMLTPDESAPATSRNAIRCTATIDADPCARWPEFDRLVK